MTKRTIVESSLIALLLGSTLPVACAVEGKSKSIGAGGAGGQAGEGGQVGGGAGASGEKPPPLPVSGGTGAFGVVVVGGIQKMYLPLAVRNAAGHGVIAVVDVGLKGDGVKGVPALIKDIDLGDAVDGGLTGSIATTTSGTADIVIAASTAAPDIWFIDPKLDRVTKHITLDATAGVSSFSGGGGYVTGIAMDPEHHRAILSVWNGFALLDLEQQEITKTIAAPPAENFGFDRQRGLILDPYYECTRSHDATGRAPAFCGDYKNSSGAAVADGLAVIKLSDESVYNYDDPAAVSPRLTTAPVGGEPDSAAADPNLGLVIVPSESSGLQNIIDIGHAKYDEQKGLFTARDYVLPGFRLTGVAIEPERHLALLEAEGSPLVGALDLNGLVPRLNADARSSEGGAGGEAGAAALDAGLPTVDPGLIDAALVRGVQATMPSLPTGAGWANIGDPHGVAVTTGISDNRAVGFLVHSQRDWVARIDLETFLSLRSTTTTVTNVSDLSSAVTFLDGRTSKNGAGGEGGGGGAN